LAGLCREKEGRTSFLKKRSKKLLLMAAGLCAPWLNPTPAAFAKVFCFFFSKKKNP
jgi:hypothetical protein